MKDYLLVPGDLEPAARMDAWFAIEDTFGLVAARRRLAGMQIDAMFDDSDIEARCEKLERELGIALELPLILKTFGDLADYCVRALVKKETQPCR
jgi:hypothetical protein